MDHAGQTYALECLEQAQESLERLAGIVTICGEDGEMNVAEYSMLRELAAGIATNLFGARTALENEQPVEQLSAAAEE